MKARLQLFLDGKEKSASFKSAITSGTITTTKEAADLIKINRMTDNWNHSEKDARLGSFLRDTYIVQQNGLCGTYAFKTTYDVTFSLAELYGVK